LSFPTALLCEKYGKNAGTGETGFEPLSEAETALSLLSSSSSSRKRRAATLTLSACCRNLQEDKEKMAIARKKMTEFTNRDVPDIRLFLDIRYPAGYWICSAGYPVSGRILDMLCRISGIRPGRISGRILSQI